MSTMHTVKRTIKDTHCYSRNQEWLLTDTKLLITNMRELLTSLLSTVNSGKEIDSYMDTVYLSLYAGVTIGNTLDMLKHMILVSYKYIDMYSIYSYIVLSSITYYSVLCITT